MFFWQWYWATLDKKSFKVDFFCEEYDKSKLLKQVKEIEESRFSLEQEAKKILDKFGLKEEVPDKKIIEEIESKLAKLGIPATYCGITALVITLLASQLGVCD